MTVDAFSQLGFISALPSSSADGRGDLLLDPDGLNCALEVKYRSLVTEDIAERLVADSQQRAPTLLVVADRVTDAARKVLTSQHGGYLDLRGRLSLRSAGILIDAEVEPIKTRSARNEAFSGKAGLEVAASILMNPERPVAVRQLARALHRSPSTVSEILAALRRDQLLGAGNTIVGTDLFWAVADHWATPSVYLAEAPAIEDQGLRSALRLGLDDVEQGEGWALTDSVAAVAYGAPLAARPEQVLNFYVNDQAIVRRATTLLGTVESAVHAWAAVRAAPVPAVVQSRVAAATDVTHWPLAHPVFVALDLAQDVGRGREILDAWTPDGRWTRVW